jgi:hypothetical protein
LLLTHAPSATAGPITDPGAFLTAVAALPGTVSSTLNFDALAVGSSPDGENGIHFQFNGDFFGDVYDIVVTSGFDTTSGANYLGIDDGGSGVFLALDDWEMSFDSPLLALGMFFITNPDGLLEGDIEIQTSAGVASNAATPFATLGDGGQVYFIGLISDGAPFSAASIGYGPAVDDVYFEYNVDDITTVTAASVAEPSAMAFTSMLLAACWARRRSLCRSDIKE